MLSNLEIPIYLVSLKADESRRVKLKERFIKYYDKFIHIEAVDGRKMTVKEYFEKTREYYISNRKMMSPAEFGCTLSHIKALETFLETDNEYALILEDDVIGSDHNIDDIFEISVKLNSDSLLLCGGQLDSLDSQYRLGKKIELKNIYKVAKFSYDFIYGACCYVVTRKSAKQILDYHSNSLTVADRWNEFFINNDTKIYYTNLISHPQTMEDSRLEQDRIYSYNNREKEKFLSKIFRKSSRYLRRAISFFKGNEKLPN